MENCVSVMMPKGGVGKTTTVANLAAALVRQGYQVLVVDNDWQGSATVHAGYKDPEELTGQGTLADVLAGHCAAADAVRKAQEGYDLIAGNGALINIDVQLIGLGEAGIYAIRKALEPIADRYDVILIDCEPGMHVRNLGALAASQYVLAPVSADYLSLKPLRLFLQVLRNAQERYRMPAHAVGVIVTRFDARQNQALEVVEVVRRMAPAAGMTWLETIVPERAAHRKAAANGSSVYDGVPGAEDLTELYNELARRVIAW